VGRWTGGQTAAAQCGALAPCAARQLAKARDAEQRCAVQRAERQLGARHAEQRCAAQLAVGRLVPQLAVRPPAVRFLAPMPVAGAQLAVGALREGEALREAPALQGRGARLALLLPAYAVARLRLSQSQQKR
jgi:hypothetical protein